jgi:hypothetical protein
MAALAMAVRTAMRVLSVIPVGQLGILLPSKRTRTPTIASRAERPIANEEISTNHEPLERYLDCPDWIEECPESFETLQTNASLSLRLGLWETLEPCEVHAYEMHAPGDTRP